MGTLKLEAVSLKNSDNLTEKWVQDQIAEDPAILGLGDLVLKDKERIQPRAGRLDLLLQDLDTLKRYEVEIQLGRHGREPYHPHHRILGPGKETVSAV
jgi:hypothetical protein